MLQPPRNILEAVLYYDLRGYFAPRVSLGNCPQVLAQARLHVPSNH